MIRREPTPLSRRVAAMIAGEEVVDLVAAAGPVALAMLEAVETFVNSPHGHAYVLYRQAFDALHGEDDWLYDIDRGVARDVDQVLTKITALIAWLDVSVVETGGELTEEYQAELDAGIAELRSRA